ncbi:MAG: fibrobacter succinogenes major paralogous domain-containing protein [Oscillospiraceae bacterium]|nr:fibrobacter succinogenes major paralogous domain-containing protein [Oscillospiraceae bacterium]
MKTKISIFIMAISLLFGVTAALAQGTQAYFKKNGATVFQSPISDIDSIVFKQTTNPDVCQSFDNPQGVVINGVRWATRNVGAPGTFASSPCDYGEYYQFNKGTTDFLLFDDYNNSVYANSDSWFPANDPSPSGWRVPTNDDIQKLTDTNYVTYEWIDNNGIIGSKFTDKATGNSIFLPATGHRGDSNGALYHVGDYGCYWSSTISYSSYVYYLNSGKDANDLVYDNRPNGFSIRPVAE